MLSNLQLEILQTFSRPLPENQILEIRQILADYFAKKVDDGIDELFEKNNWNVDEKVSEWLGEHMKTEYKNKPMRMVIDTNCFLAILPKKSNFRSIFDAYRQGKFELAISTEILDEYAEVFEQKMNPEISENIIELILKLPNSVKTEIYYRWALIHTDYDDNKFVDTAISANADYIITSDRHFNILNQTPFPKVKVISLDAFMDILKEH